MKMRQANRKWGSKIELSCAKDRRRPDGGGEGTEREKVFSGADKMITMHCAVSAPM